VAEEPGPSLTEMREWLVTNGIFEEGLSDTQIDRRYNVFSSVEFGEYAHSTKTELFRDLLHIESNCAAYQDDIGHVQQWPFKMRVKEGQLIR